MRKMKALVLAGGRGRRIAPQSEGLNKCLLRVAGKPLLEYSLDSCVRLAVEEIVVVVGHLAEQVMDRYGDRYRGVPITYALQPEPKGLVDAIDAASPLLGGADFLLLLADEIVLGPHHAGMIERFGQGDVLALCGVSVPENRDDVRKTYAVIEGMDGRITRLIEKPDRPLSPNQGTGNLVCSNRLLDYVGRTPINPARGEKELADLLQSAIDDGQTIRSFPVGDRYLNVNTPEDLAEAERALVEWSRARSVVH